MIAGIFIGLIFGIILGDGFVTWLCLPYLEGER